MLAMVSGCGSDAVVPPPPDARSAADAILVVPDASVPDAATAMDGRAADAATPPPDAPLPDAAAPPPDARPSDAPPASDAVSLLPDAPAPKDADVNTPPIIQSVTWTAPEPCSMAVPGIFTIVVEATDAETPGALTYQGSVTSCSGSIDGPDDSVTCPNVSPYVGQVTVTDPDGLFDRAFFTIEPCESGST
jgi:hypothetical protein